MPKSEPTRGKDGGGSYDSLAKLLPEFAKLGEFSLVKFDAKTSLVSNESDKNAEPPNTVEFVLHAY